MDCSSGVQLKDFRLFASDGAGQLSGATPDTPETFDRLNNVPLCQEVSLTVF